MKYWKRLLALLLSGAMALSLFACDAVGGSESPRPLRNPPPGPPASPTPAPPRRSWPT